MGKDVGLLADTGGDEGKDGGLLAETGTVMGGGDPVGDRALMRAAAWFLASGKIFCSKSFLTFSLLLNDLQPKMQEAIQHIVPHNIDVPPAIYAEIPASSSSP